LILLGTALLPVLARADDSDLRWTNTVRLSTLYQVNWVPPLADDMCSAGLNCGYGADFTQGRADFLSELDWSRGNYGLRASLEARKDAVETASSFIDLSEAYVHDTFALFGKPLTAAVGRQSVIWGESLYFAGNGIAGAQAPIDSTASDTTGYSATHFLPVGQASLSWQVGSDITLVAYQQFEWRRNRVDAEDAYAPAGDVLGNDHLSRIALYNPEYGPVYYGRAGNDRPGGTDQFGVGVKLRRDDWDLGLYALQFDAKTPDLFYVRGIHTYSLTYARGAGLIGASFSGPLGEATLAGEVSARRHAQLVQGGIFINPSRQDAAEFGPRGDTLHGQVSATLPIEPVALLPGGADWTTELAANRLTAITANPDQLAPGRTRDAAALRTVLTAKFYQVLPRVDLSVPLGIGWNFAGNSTVLPEMNRGTGDISLGVAATFDQSWTASLTGTHYFGRDNVPVPGYFGHPMSNWDKIAASVQYSF